MASKNANNEQSELGARAFTNPGKIVIALVSDPAVMTVTSLPEGFSLPFVDTSRPRAYARVRKIGRGSQVVRSGSAKPLFAGSIPAPASPKSIPFDNSSASTGGRRETLVPLISGFLAWIRFDFP
jgi:hypothetical protein